MKLTPFIHTFSLWASTLSLGALAAEQPLPLQLLMSRVETGDPYAMAELAARYGNGDGVPQDFCKAYTLALKAAEYGVARAEHVLGTCYWRGVGVVQNLEEAIKWMELAAEHGHIPSLGSLGVMLLERNSSPKDIERGVALLEKGIEQGDAQALNNLAVAYHKGIGVREDKQKAFQLFLQSAECGNPVAMDNVSQMYEQGMGVAPDAQKAFEWLSKSARAKAPDADQLTRLGDMYMGGMGTSKNTSKAFQLYKQAAALGHLRAMSNVAAFYMEGIDGVVQKNAAAALEYLLPAAAQGEAGAISNLGIMHIQGMGMPQDVTKGVELLTQAAAQNYRPALIALAQIYGTAKGVEQNLPLALRYASKAADQGDAKAMTLVGDLLMLDHQEEQAYAWYTRAAEAGHLDAMTKLAFACAEKEPRRAYELALEPAKQGDAKACYLLGALFYTGRGVEANLAEAVAWTRRAAEAGDAVSQFNLGVSYRDGKGVKSNADEAVRWFSLSAKQGNAEAQYNLADMLLTGPKKYRHPVRALELLRQAASQGHTNALYAMAQMLCDGEGVPKDAAKGIAYLRQAVAQGSPEAMLKLAALLHEGHDLPKDNAEALRLIKKSSELGLAEQSKLLLGLLLIETGEDAAQGLALLQPMAEQGDGQAQYILHELYHRGQYVPANRELALLWLRRAAESNMPNAQLHLMTMLLEGNESEQAEGVELCRRLAAQNSKEAIIQLAMIYLKGAAGVEPAPAEAERILQPLVQKHDPDVDFPYGFALHRTGKSSEALPYILHAAKRGHTHAQYMMGILCREGVGMEKKDLSTAAAWLEKSAQQGYLLAMQPLADLHYHGPKEMRDFGKALLWFRRAAESGDANAQYHLALMTLCGHGMKSDPAAAARMLTRLSRESSARPAPWANFVLGMQYLRGVGVPENKVAAYRLLNRAVKQNNALAAYVLYSLRRFCIQVPGDAEAAETLSAQLSPEEQVKLGTKLLPYLAADSPEAKQEALANLLYE